MAPTRELANQIAKEITILGKHRGVRCLPIYGGVGYGAQLEGLKEGAHVIVGTPGRMLDHLGAGRLRFDAIKIVVFDEADELLSLGFWPDMKEIRSYLPDRRQNTPVLGHDPREGARALARLPARARSSCRWSRATPRRARSSTSTT